MSPNAPDISIAICTYERYDRLALAIESCRAQTLEPGGFEVLIIDNSPASPRQDASRAAHGDQGGVTYHCEPTPGLSNARNVALSMARAPIIAYLDDDAIAEPAWAAHLLRAFERHKNAGAVGGRIDPLWETPRPDWLPQELERFFTVLDWGGDTRPLAEGEWIAGANMAFRVEALRALGGFDTALGRKGSGAMLLSNEELAVCERLKQAGGSIIYAPHARVEHWVGRERLTQAWIRRRQVWQAISDFTAEPDRFAPLEQQYWSVVQDYLAQLAPRARGFHGLFAEAPDKAAFHRQIMAVYCAAALLMMGGGDPAALAREPHGTPADGTGHA